MKAKTYRVKEGSCGRCPWLAQDIVHDANVCIASADGSKLLLHEDIEIGGFKRPAYCPLGLGDGEIIWTPAATQADPHPPLGGEETTR